MHAPPRSPGLAFLSQVPGCTFWARSRAHSWGGGWAFPRCGQKPESTLPHPPAGSLVTGQRVSVKPSRAGAWSLLGTVSPKVARCAPCGEGHTSPWWFPPIFSPWGAGETHAGSCDPGLGSLKGLALWVSLAVLADGLVLGDKLFFILRLKITDVTGTPAPKAGLSVPYAPGRRVLWNVLCPALGNCDALSSGPRSVWGSVSRQAALGCGLASGRRSWHAAGAEPTPRGCDAGKLSNDAAWF